MEYELEGMSVCWQCVGEEYLRAEINREGMVRQCSYCGKTRESFTVGGLAERIECAFGQHYMRLTHEATYWQEFVVGVAVGGDSAVDAIGEAAQIDPEIAEDVQKILEAKHADFGATGEETEFNSESYYEKKGIGGVFWELSWMMFEKELKTEARFFNKSVEAHLSSLFNDLERITTDGRSPLLIDAGPSTSVNTLYRARVFESDEELKKALCQPDSKLGPPPDRSARAGRMNANGISVFYGATDANVAIAETRPPVGSQVAVATFEIIRPIRLLDITAFDTIAENGSIFDEELAKRMERAVFLQSLSRRIAKPIMPDDEALDYLPTQAIADYFATRSAPEIDGIMFQSTQCRLVNALNVVLFHKAARVEAMNVPDGIEIRAEIFRRQDHSDPEYNVFEKAGSEALTDKSNSHAIHDSVLDYPAELFEELPQKHDFRVATLRIQSGSIAVHAVEGVRFDTRKHAVRRHPRIMNDS